MKDQFGEKLTERSAEEIYKGKGLDSLYKLHNKILELSNKENVEDLLQFLYNNKVRVIVAHPSTGNSRFSDHELLHKVLTFEVNKNKVIKAIA